MFMFRRQWIYTGTSPSCIMAKTRQNSTLYFVVSQTKIKEPRTLGRNGAQRLTGLAAAAALHLEATASISLLHLL